MKNKSFVKMPSIFIVIMLMGSGLIVTLSVNANEISQYGTNMKNVNENSTKEPHKLMFNTADPEKTGIQILDSPVQNHNTQDSKLNFDPSTETRQCVKYDPFPKPKPLQINVDNNPGTYVHNNHELRHNVSDSFNYDGTLNITSIRDGGTTEPPWDESDSGVEYVIATTNLHYEWWDDNRYIGLGQLQCSASCGFASFVLTHIYCWFKGSYVCTNSGDHYVNFDIDYDGLVSVVDVPEIQYTGADKLEILSIVQFQLAGQQVEQDLIFFGDSWPNVGNYEIPGPWDEQGPFKIGYDDYVYLEANYEYEFVVQFDIFLDCAAFGFTVVGGGMDLDGWLLSADIEPVYNPSFVDLVSAEAILIGNQIGYTIWTDPWYFEPGDDVVIHAIIWNNGIHDANGFRVAIGLSDLWYGLSDLVNCSAGNWPDNAIHFYTNPFEWPSDTNTYYVWCHVDCYEEIDEIVEDNNLGIHPHKAEGTPYLDLEDITLVQCDPWPPNHEEIDWQQADSFIENDRVTPLALITNDGDGTSFGLEVELYMDGVLFAEGEGILAGGGTAIAYVVDQYNDPGFNWPDSNSHTFRWEIREIYYGQYDYMEETYSPEVNPDLSYHPSSIDFGTHSQGWTGSDEFEIWNSGDGVLTYSISESLSWISFSPTGGSSTGEHDTITVNVVNTGSMLGHYSGTISISSNGGSGSVYVEIDIEENNPSLSFSPTTIDFGTHSQGWTGSATFEIWNSGTGTLTYSFNEDINWISVNPASGSSTGEHDIITVSVINTDNLIGHNYGYIYISSNGGSDSVFVEITIDKGWTVPDDHNDPDNEWDDESNAYDTNTNTKATCEITEFGWVWTPWLEFSFNSPKECSMIRWWAWWDSLHCDQIEIKVYNGAQQVFSFSGVYDDREWEEWSLGSQPKTVTDVKVRFHVKRWPLYPVVADLHELQFYQVSP